MTSADMAAAAHGAAARPARVDAAASPAASARPSSAPAGDPAQDTGARDGSARPASPVGRALAFLRRHHALAWTVAIIMVLEVVVFNLPHWQSLATPGPESSAMASVTFGPGLRKGDISGSTTGSSEHLVTIVDSTASYVEVTGLNSAVGFVKVVHDEEMTDTNDLQRKVRDHFRYRLNVRVDVLPANSSEWVTGRVNEYAANAPASLYIKNVAYSGKAQAVRLWFQESNKTMFDLTTVQVNARPPFSLSALRLVIEALVAAFILLLRPSSRLYRIRLDTASRWQRWAFVALMAPYVVYFLAQVVVNVLWFTVDHNTHNPGIYTYDFNQYQHLADSLLAGKPWLDLEVPLELAQVDDPQSVTTRNELLAQGVTPIYWDYVFWHGHWYSYFGVLPAAVFFLPFRAITSLFVPGGLTLPTPVVVTLLLAVFAVMGSLLVIRLMVRFFRSTASVGMTALCLLSFLCGSNVFFLLYRPNFYSLPMASSLALTMTGLWLWFGARRMALPADAGTGAKGATTADASSTSASSAEATQKATQKAASQKAAQRRGPRTRMWTIADGGFVEACARGEGRLSLLRIGLGSLCIGANLGCRPPFILAALLAFPIFWDEIRSGMILSFLNPRVWKAARKAKAASGDVTADDAHATVSHGTAENAHATAANTTDGETHASTGEARAASPSTATPATPHARKASPARTLFASLAIDMTALLPAVAIMLPMLAYNRWRFGSFTDFGNNYQLTVSDLTTYKEPLELVPQLTWYYLFQPPVIRATFPFVALTQTPVSQWQLTEPHAGGFFALTPFAFLAFGFFMLRKQLRHHRLWGVTCWMLGLAAALCLFDIVKAGLSWRYMTDFGWLVIFPAIFIGLIIEDKVRQQHFATHALLPGLIIGGLFVAVGFGLAITFVGFLMPGRYDAMANGVPGTYEAIRSWFAGFI